MIEMFEMPDYTMLYVIEGWKHMENGGFTRLECLFIFSAPYLAAAYDEALMLSTTMGVSFTVGFCHPMEEP